VDAYIVMIMSWTSLMSSASRKKDKAMIKKTLLKKVVKVDTEMETDFVSRLVAAMKQINQA